MSQPRTRRARARRGEGDRLREELIAAATEVLGRGGVGGLTLRAVAREAGVAAPSVYLHFPDLNALVAAVEERLMTDIAESTTRAVEAAPDPASALHAGCRAYIDLALGHPARYRALFTGRPRTEAGVRAGAEALGVLQDAVAACLASDANASARDPRATAIDVWTALHGMADLRAGAPTFGWPPLEEQLTGLLQAIVGPGAVSRPPPERRVDHGGHQPSADRPAQTSSPRSISSRTPS